MKRVKKANIISMLLSILLVLTIFGYFNNVNERKYFAAANSTEVYTSKSVKKNYFYKNRYYDYIVLNKGEKVKLNFKNDTISKSLSAKTAKIDFTDSSVASLGFDGNLIAKKLGKTLMSVKYNDEELFLMVIVLESNLIKINNMETQEYATVDLKTYNGSSVMAQDFIIDEDNIYLSYSHTGTVNNIKNLDTTINYVARCKRENCNDTKKYIAFKGSAQSYKFDMYSVKNNKYFILSSRARNIKKNNSFVSDSVYYKLINFNYKYSTNNKSISDCFDSLSTAYFRMNNWDRFNLKEKSTLKIAKENKSNITSSDISLDESSNLLAIRKASIVEIYYVDLSSVNLKNKMYTINLNSSGNKIPVYIDKKGKKQNLYIKDILINGRYLYVLFSIRDNNAKSYIYTYDIYSGNLVKNNILRLDNSSKLNSSFDSLELYDNNMYFSVSYKDKTLKNKIYKITKNQKKNSSKESAVVGEKVDLNDKIKEKNISWKYISGNSKYDTNSLKKGIFKTNILGTTILGAFDINGVEFKRLQVESKSRKVTIIVGDSRIKYLTQSLSKKESNESYSYKCSKIHWSKNEKDFYDWNTCEYTIKDKDYPNNTIYLIFMGGGNYNWFDKTFDNPYSSKDEFLKNRIKEILKSSYATDVNIVFNVGVNSLQINKYLYNGVKEFNTVNKVINYIKKNNYKNNINFHYNYLSINPIDEKMLNRCQANNIRTLNDINAFNKILETSASQIGYSFCSSYDEFKYQYMKRDPEGCQDGDGIHYNTNTDYKIFKFIMEKCLK